MSVSEYIDKMKIVQQNLLNYIDHGSEEEFQQFCKLVSTYKIDETKNDLKSLLQLICSIVNNHHRLSDFFTKIKNILHQYISSIKQKLTPKELVKLFKSCKIILLFFIDEKIISINDLPQTTDFFSYFYPEFEEKMNETQKQACIDTFKKYNIEYSKEEFIQNRKSGENDSYICSLIRNDSIEDFIACLNKNDLANSTKIPPSFFDTNAYLKNNECNLIEYSAFFGSIQIFNYLKTNDFDFKKLWVFAIHGDNAEIIQYLEEKQSEDDMKNEKKYDKLHPHKKHFKQKKDRSIELTKNFNIFSCCFIESIKCHHNEMADYFKCKIIEFDQDDQQNKQFDDVLKTIKNEIKKIYRNMIEQDVYNYNYNQKDDEELYNENTFNIKYIIADSIFGNYNYHCFPNQLINEKYCCSFCEYDYYNLVELLINSKKIKINEIVILKNKRFI